MNPGPPRQADVLHAVGTLGSSASGITVERLVESASDLPARSALAVAEGLKAELASLNVPGVVMGDAEKAVCSLWPYLVAMRMIWWCSPYPGTHGRELWTFAWVAATAAGRLADHYQILSARPLPAPLAELVELALNRPGGSSAIPQ